MYPGIGIQAARKPLWLEDYVWDHMFCYLLLFLSKKTVHLVQDAGIGSSKMLPWQLTEIKSWSTKTTETKI